MIAGTGLFPRGSGPQGGRLLPVVRARPVACVFLTALILAWLLAVEVPPAFAADQHSCGPPKEDPPKDEPLEWTCPECGARWRIRVVAEGYRFHRGGGSQPFTHTDWERIGDATN
jgi:hypothetical protein